jgi:hypothetical protein
VVWVAFVAVLFMLPEVKFSSIDHDNFNCPPVAAGKALVCAGGYWLLSARKWSTGPKSHGDEAAFESIVAEFNQVEEILEEVG